MPAFVEVLIQRAIEIVAALAFVFVLVKSLKRSARPSAASAEARAALGAAPEKDVDLDVLARAHVDELLRTNPEKVGQLLSRWAKDETHYSRSGT